MSVRPALLLLAAFILPAASARSQGATAAEPAAAAAGPVSVAARADKSAVTIGEVFSIELKAMGPDGTSYTFPAEASTDSFELRSAALPAGPGGTRESAGGSPRGEATAAAEPGLHRYQTMVFGLGEVEIPAIPVRYRLPDGTTGEASSEPLKLRVVSLLSKDPDERKLADVRGPVDARIGRAFWIAIGVALLVAGGLAYALLRRRRRLAAPAATPRVPELPPAAQALGALDALAARGLAERGEFRVFYIELTLVAKRYLERRLSAPVVEMTSTETLAFLRAHPHGGELLPIVRELADAADRIKFANAAGLAGEAQRHLASARRLVAALEERLRPAEPTAEGEAA